MSLWKNVTHCIIIVFAGMLYAVALKYFIFPAHVILTGTEGISVAIAYYFDNHWLFIWLYSFFQFLLLTFAFFKISFRFAFRSMLVVASVVGLLSILPEYQFASPEPQHERIMLVIFGGILAGIAKAIALRYSASTADEDILAAYFSMKYLKPVGNIAVIAAAISTVFGLTLTFIKTGELSSVINTLMYTSIYIFMSAETLNNFYRKFKLALVNIITKNPDAIGENIRTSLPHRTYTIQEGFGGYAKERVKLLQTIVTQEELPNIVRIIEAADKNTFFFHHDVEGVSKHYYIAPIQ